MFKAIAIFAVLATLGVDPVWWVLTIIGLVADIFLFVVANDL